MKISKSKFIVFEGIDGSGKTTLSNMVYDYFNKSGISVVKMQEPTDGKWGREIRELLNKKEELSASELMRLFIKDREEDVEKNIIPSLKANRMIIMDRYYYSNAAYQGAMGIPADSILMENREMGFPVPDRVYLIDIDPEIAVERISARSGNGSDFFEKRKFLEKVRSIYNTIADKSFYTLDGTCTPDELFQITRNDIEKYIYS